MLLIETALAQCQDVIVLSYCRPGYPGCSAARRERWLRKLFPGATVLVTDDADAPANDAADDVHRRYCARLLSCCLRTTVDAVFTSEGYGEGFAAVLSAKQHSSVTHVCVDRTRNAVPISGTQLRADLHAHREHLHPEVYADYVQRVCLLGAESTGKSTLAVEMAAKFGTIHVAEYGRQLWTERRGRLQFDDYRVIVLALLQQERAAVRGPGVHRYVFCDTSPLTTLFYQLDQFGRADGVVAQAALEHRYDHVFLCEADFPLVQDGTRRDETFRRRQQAWLERELRQRGIPHVRLGGSLAARASRVEDILSAQPHG